LEAIEDNTVEEYEMCINAVDESTLYTNDNTLLYLRKIFCLSLRLCFAASMSKMRLMNS